MSQASKIALAIIITAIIMGGGVYFWQKQKITQNGAPVEADLAIYSSENFSFQYPKQFFLLDRLNEDKRIYISPNPISFNEFLNGYYEPIEISLTDESKGNSVIDALEQKDISQTNIGGQNALVISGVIPENPPYYAFNVFAIIFPDKKISIIVKDEFKLLSNKSIDTETIARKIASTFQFK